MALWARLCELGFSIGNIFFDAGCQLRRHVWSYYRHSGLIQCGILPNAFHVESHQRACRDVNAALRAALGAGVFDGEGMERGWAAISEMSAVVRTATYRHFVAFNERAIMVYHATLSHNLANVLVKQLARCLHRRRVLQNLAKVLRQRPSSFLSSSSSQADSNSTLDMVDGDGTVAAAAAAPATAHEEKLVQRYILCRLSGGGVDSLDSPPAVAATAAGTAAAATSDPPASSVSTLERHQRISALVLERAQSVQLNPLITRLQGSQDATRSHEALSERIRVELSGCEFPQDDRLWALDGSLFLQGHALGLYADIAGLAETVLEKHRSFLTVDSRHKMHLGTSMPPCCCSRPSCS